MLLVASLILILCGIVHSYLGEKYILTPLFRKDNIPHLFGNDEFTKGTLRFCWHITSIAWFGFAALLSSSASVQPFLLYVVSIVFLLSGLFALFLTKGKQCITIRLSIVPAKKWPPLDAQKARATLGFEATDWLRLSRTSKKRTFSAISKTNFQNI